MKAFFSTDLARIRQQVKEGALQRLSAKPGPKQSQVSTEAYEAIKFELQNKERALADLSVELAILRIKRMGFAGLITGTWLTAQTKLEIINVMATSRQQGVSTRHICSLLLIEHRRVVRWQHQARAQIGGKTNG